MSGRSIVRLLVLAAFVSLAAACGFAGPSLKSAEPSAAPTVRQQVLVITLQGGEGTDIGAIDVSIAFPAGVVVKAQENGMLESGALYSPLPSGRQFMTGKFSGGTLRAALLNPAGIPAGEVLKARMAGPVVPVDAFRVTALQVIDQKGKAVEGVSVRLSLE